MQRTLDHLLLIILSLQLRQPLSDRQGQIQVSHQWWKKPVFSMLYLQVYPISRGQLSLFQLDHKAWISQDALRWNIRIPIATPLLNFGAHWQIRRLLYTELLPKLKFVKKYSHQKLRKHVISKNETLRKIIFDQFLKWSLNKPLEVRISWNLQHQNTHQRDLPRLHQYRSTLSHLSI